MTDKIKASAIISIIGTLITVGTVVFGGGTLYQRVSANETRLVHIEAEGSASFNEHRALDDERERALAARVARLETAIENISELRADIREIKTELKNRGAMK